MMLFFLTIITIAILSTPSQSFLTTPQQQRQQQRQQPQQQPHFSSVSRVSTWLYSSTNANANANTMLIDIEETAERDMTTLENWAMECGVQRNDGLAINQEQSPDHGREIAPDMSFVAQDNIPADSPLLWVSEEMVLTGNKAQQELGEGYAPMELYNDDPLLLPQFYLFLKLLLEYEQGPESPYSPWLNSLPRFFANGASMTDFCYGSLPPYAAQVSLEEKQLLQQFHSALFKNEVPFLSMETKQNWELCTWAYSVVRTRGLLYGDNDVCLAPMADLFNHCSDAPEAYISIDDDGNCCSFAATDIPAGSPVRISYYDSHPSTIRSNPSLLLSRYGFLDETGNAQFCKLIVDNPSPEMKDMGIADPSQLLFYNTGDIADPVWDLVLYQYLEREDPDQLPGFYQATLQEDWDTKQQYHEHYFPQTLQALSKHVDYLCHELEELSQNGWKRKESYMERHPRLPLLMRHNAHVLETFEKVQDNLDGMKQ